MTNKPRYESPKFHFLTTVDPLLVELGARAQHYALGDPNTSMLKIRQLGELLAQSAAAKFGIQTDSRNQEQRGLIDDLYRRFLPSDIKDLFHSVRMEGNQAIHQLHGDQGHGFVRKIAVWYYRARHYGIVFQPFFHSIGSAFMSIAYLAFSCASFVQGVLPFSAAHELERKDNDVRRNSIWSNLTMTCRSTAKTTQQSMLQMSLQECLLYE